MVKTGIAKEPEKRPKYPKPQYEWVPPTGFAFFVGFGVAAAVHHFAGVSWTWAASFGCATLIWLTVISVFDAIADLKAELRSLGFCLFGGVYDESPSKYQFGTVQRYGEYGALNELRGQLKTLTDDLDEQIRREGRQ